MRRDGPVVAGDGDGDEAGGCHCLVLLVVVMSSPVVERTTGLAACKDASYGRREGEQRLERRTEKEEGGRMLGG